MTIFTSMRQGFAGHLIVRRLIVTPLIVIGMLTVVPITTSAQSTTGDDLPPLHKLGVSAQDHRVRLEQAGWPWTSLGRVNRAIGGFCTGALVAPHWMLTAAHCVYNFDDRHWAIPSDIHFVVGYDDADRPSEMAHDWALVELDRDLTEKPIPIARQEISLANGPVTVTVAGYSGDFEEVLTAHRNCQIVGQASPKIWLHDCDATFGASGSPLLRINGGAAEIVAIQSGVVTFKDKKEISTAAPLSSFLPALSALAQ